jgi:opacity protein-like surface antigen
MRMSGMGKLLLIASASLLASAAHAADADKYQAPRNEYGQPQLNGVWNFSSDVPLQRPKDAPDKLLQTREDIEKSIAAREQQFEQFTQQGVGFHNTFWLDYRSQSENLRTSLLVYPLNGRLPKLVDGVTKVGGFAAAFKDVPGTRPVRFGFGGIGKEGPEDRGLSERCIAADNGPPITPGFDNNYLQIFQGRDHVVILNEQIHDARTVFLDGRPPPDGAVRGWYGYSRGHWEGDTLVIETGNFNGLTQSFDSSGTSYDKVVTERLTRSSDQTIEYEATVVDPKTFTDRFTLVFPMAKTDKRIYEFACHEGNYSMELILSGARKEEADALQAKQ